MKVIKYLEKGHDWDVHVKSNGGNDAYYYAKLFKFNEIIKHLENKMFYEKLSKMLGEFIESKDNQINQLTEKIQLVKSVFV